MTKHRETAFTLIELMLVVAIISTVLSIALPSLSRAKVTSQETAAIQYARTWAAAQEQYKIPRSRFGTPTEIEDDNIIQIKTKPGEGDGDFGLDYAAMTDGDDEEVIAFSAAQHDSFGYQGYIWVHEINAANTAWVLHGIPYLYGTSGNRSIYIDTTGVIRAADKEDQGNTPFPGDDVIGG